ncbi:MAG: phosphate ABC transporter permease PstA [Alphaproteobacteria bacterium]|nr:phosphate ABC transporter permease PstA [Alphaproteobacteria bacterium]
MAPARAPDAVRSRSTSLRARGEPFVWLLGGALAFGVMMIVGFLLLVLWNGIAAFFPKPLAEVRLTDGSKLAGEPTRRERYPVTPEQLGKLASAPRAAILAADGVSGRTLYRIGNYDIYNEDFRWVSDFEVTTVAYPAQLMFVERREWGPLVGSAVAMKLGNEAERPMAAFSAAAVTAAHREALARWERIRHLERGEIGRINHYLEQGRLRVRRAELRHGTASAEAQTARAAAEEQARELQKSYDAFSGEARDLRQRDATHLITFAEIGGKTKTLPLSGVVRMYAANDLHLMDKLAVYVSRWWEFLSDEPREANTEGGVLPAIFGTFAMTLLLVLVVAPFGVVTALYLREYARQGRLVSIVRISVNNLAGVPSIVYGVFGLGFFAYILGGTIDQVFFSERLPSPTFGTGGLLWSSLTLALLTVPVVIVATEEALAAVPRSMREGSLACGASKWQTIRNIVLPRAMPGIMTGIILAMARGAGEVAPLMLVGVVKLAPELPIDGFFPYIHLERSFMHLGFHIFDVGFQSRNSEAGKPMVFVTTVLLVALVAAMNASAIIIRSRLKRKFQGSQF